MTCLHFRSRKTKAGVNFVRNQAGNHVGLARTAFWAIARTLPASRSLYRVPPFEPAPMNLVRPLQRDHPAVNRTIRNGGIRVKPRNPEQGRAVDPSAPVPGNTAKKGRQ